MRYRSPKRMSEARQRAVMVRDQLGLRPWCEVGVRPICRLVSSELHEPLTRARGGSILDPANTVAICRPCHDHVHANPKWATERGLLRSAHGSSSG